MVGFGDVSSRGTEVKLKSYAGNPYAAVFTLLAIASAVGIALVGARVARSHTSHYGFLVWNLFLAWVPVVLAALAYRVSFRRGVVGRLTLVLTAVVWLAFFPNAPYIITDFVHLVDIHDHVPLWYDVILIAWYAWTGLLLGILSLRLMQDIVQRGAGRVAGWSLVAAVTVLGSIGIYIGRFLHWNSWQAFQSPGTLAHRAFGGAGEPDVDVRFLGFSALFAALFLFVYLAVYLLGAGRDRA
jgi:uncharacterized membrane protein